MASHQQLFTLSDDYRRENLLKLKRHFHEVLLDQLPVLKDLQHVLDEMAMGIDAAATDQHKSSRLILEQVLAPANTGVLSCNHNVLICSHFSPWALSLVLYKLINTLHRCIGTIEPLSVVTHCPDLAVHAIVSGNETYVCLAIIVLQQSLTASALNDHC